MAAKFIVQGQPKIKCAKKTGHGIISLEGSLMFSCNDALMQMGAMIGYDNFLKYQQIFNFGLKTNIDLPGETNNASTVFTKDTMGPVELATQLFRSGLQYVYDSGGFGLFFRYQWRLLLPAPRGEEDSERGGRHSGDCQSGAGAPDHFQ